MKLPACGTNSLLAESSGASPVKDTSGLSKTSTASVVHTGILGCRLKVLSPVMSTCHTGALKKFFEPSSTYDGLCPRMEGLWAILPVTAEVRARATNGHAHPFLIRGLEPM